MQSTIDGWIKMKLKRRDERKIEKIKINKNYKKNSS